MFLDKIDGVSPECVARNGTPKPSQPGMRSDGLPVIFPHADRRPHEVRKGAL